MQILCTKCNNLVDVGDKVCCHCGAILGDGVNASQSTKLINTCTRCGCRWEVRYSIEAAIKCPKCGLSFFSE